MTQARRNGFTVHIRDARIPSGFNLPIPEEASKPSKRPRIPPQWWLIAAGVTMVTTAVSLVALLMPTELNPSQPPAPPAAQMVVVEAESTSIEAAVAAQRARERRVNSAIAAARTIESKRGALSQDAETSRSDVGRRR